MRKSIKSLLNQFKQLTSEEKLAFTKEAMPLMWEEFGSDNWFQIL